ncbi:MAG: helix-turn-helix transcriptional regulator [Clostridiales bacterium]|nr:helix-turn-helix transcriptional regulator [Clostridiales bacterium]
MKLNEAVSERIRELCSQRGMTQYKLFLASGVPQSTLSTVMSCSFPNVKLRIIYEICEGLQISMEEFFASPLFARENLDD